MNNVNGKRSHQQGDDSDGTWESQHRRVTFHCPTDLLEALEAEMAVSGRSKSEVIREALAECLVDDDSPTR
jgi:hypothetical protein